MIEPPKAPDMAHVTTIYLHRTTNISSPIIVCAVLFFLIPTKLDFIRFFKKRGGCTIIEALRTSKMTEEFEQFFLLLRNWPAPAQALVVILVCKMLTECCSNSCVVFVMLPHIAKVSVEAKVNPHYLMTATTLACSVPFHLVSGTPANALVVDYVRIPPWKMMHAGLGPSLIAIVVIWFTVTLWSKAIFPDINLYPPWADDFIANYDYPIGRRH
ncbi:protein I'm not dead yet-like isoform X2 [Pectinophora gossypiella]|uniref:protein I'm not dead yet-like isoform X2 n=1 Tax=Pectinophora gossypiella TaxID=13191 RepID=UPI00214E3E12|nr:protein I'm not dead yet-like isoform X2 [Pectinophora gossypiella]